MHPHTPQDSRAFESSEREAPDPADRNPMRDRTRYAARPMLVAVVLLVAIIALIALL